MNAELIEDAFGIGQHVHEVRDGRALITAYIGNAGLQQRLGDCENALAMKLLAFLEAELLNFLGERALCHYAGTSANTRKGLPEPFTIFNGGANTTAPVGGSLSRLVRLASPNLLEPCM